MGVDMTKEGMNLTTQSSFEALRKTNEHSAEYWSARDLQPLLGYSQWRRFEDAIKRAMISSEASGNDPAHHFASAGKPILGGKGAVQVVDDYHLSRFACYFLAQNMGTTVGTHGTLQGIAGKLLQEIDCTDLSAMDPSALELTT
jgi:DNA-damage-inducible protein D